MTRGVWVWWSLGIVTLMAGPVRASQDEAAMQLPIEVKQDAASDAASDDAAPAQPSEAAGDEGKPLRVSMEFEGADLTVVLKAFSQQTGINIIASQDIATQPITLYLEDVSVMDALDQILRAGNLTYERPPGSDIYIVSKKKEGEEVKRITRVYRLKYARVSASVLARAEASLVAGTPFEAQAALEEGSGSSSSGTSGGGGGGGGGGSPGEGTKGIDEVIKELLTKDVGTLVVDGRTNRLIITDLAENFPRIEAALAALDVRTPQVMVDAELVETTIGKLKDLGVEWGTGSSGTLFKLTPAKAETKLPFGQFFGEPQNGIGGEGLKRALLKPDGSASIADPRLTVGTLDTSQAIALLNAIETDTDSKILARPKVMTLDNESAVIRMTTKEAIGFTSSAQTQTGTQNSEPERETTGVLLVVTPQINDNGYITMLVEPTVTKTVISKLTPPSTQGSAIKDPKTRKARTLVRIRSGDTLVIGGLIDRSEEQSFRRVPILSGIPFFGEAFKHSGVDNSSSELIVFITPRVLDEPDAARLATSGQTPLGLREQEPSGAKQESIEQSLNTLEQEKPL